MILWLDGAHRVREQMRRDAALLAAAENTPAFEPVMRLFTFDPPGITLGHAQRPEKELDLERCAALGAEWAIRPTGGRAIFHAREWTYSLAARIDDLRFGGSLAGAYEATSRVLLEALQRLGVEAAMAPAPARGPTPGPHAPAGPASPCFATTTRHEIVLNGRKLVGSAQRRLGRALLQQGSILVGRGHERLADCLPVDAAGREAVRAALLRGTACLEDVLAAPDAVAWGEAVAVALGTPRRLAGDAGLELLTPAEGPPYAPEAAPTGHP